MDTQFSSFLIICLCALIFSSQGLQVSMDRNPGKYFCGHLQCWNNVIPDGNIFTTTAMAIYDTTQPGNRIRIASVSSDGTGFSINQAKINDVNGTGSISRYHADVTLDFRNEIDCLYGNFQCELEFVNRAGQIDFIRQNATVGNSSNYCSCPIFTYQMSILTRRLDQVENDSSILEEELVSLRQQNNLLVLQLDTLSRQVSGILNSMKTSTPPTVITTQHRTTAIHVACTKGMAHTSSREKFLLWGTTLALCDTETDGGGWVVIQRRTKGDVYFNRNWNEYKNGFGNPDTDFWIGNDIIHNLTASGFNELRIDMALSGTQYFAHYSMFDVDNEQQNYRLTVTGYSGTAGDSLKYHDGMMFSTYDRDNDNYLNSCASVWRAAWWYNDCYSSNLNGNWGNNNNYGVMWFNISSTRSLSFTEMKIRHI